MNLAGSVSLDLSWVPFMGQYFSSLGFVNLLLGVIMFGMGMTLRAEDFALILRRPRDVLVGICSQYVCMAGFGWLVAKLLASPVWAVLRPAPRSRWAWCCWAASPGGTALQRHDLPGPWRRAACPSPSPCAPRCWLPC